MSINYVWITQWYSYFWGCLLCRCFIAVRREFITSWFWIFILNEITSQGCISACNLPTVTSTSQYPALKAQVCFRQAGPEPHFLCVFHTSQGHKIYSKCTARLGEGDCHRFSQVQKLSLRPELRDHFLKEKVLTLMSKLDTCWSCKLPCPSPWLPTLLGFNLFDTFRQVCTCP